jgi:uncharacterized membrane protein (Fun14 family)
MTEKKDMVEEAIEKAKPIIAKLSFGALMGYCSGMALKKVGKALAIVVGLGFIALQTASSTGYIAVDWTKILDDVKAKADTNADGSINTEDVKVRRCCCCCRRRRHHGG